MFEKFSNGINAALNRTSPTNSRLQLYRMRTETVAHSEPLQPFVWLSAVHPRVAPIFARNHDVYAVRSSTFRNVAFASK